MAESVTVVKCGGSAAIDVDHVCADIARLRAAGERLVLVHGGATDIERLAAQLGVPSRTLVAPNGMASRYTDDAMLDTMTLAMTGRVKPRLLTALAAVGVRAVGLTGLDAGLLTATRKAARRAVRDGRTVIVRDDRSGRLAAVDPTVLHVLLDAGLLPVVSPPATAPGGAVLNVDADRVAAAVAVALGAERLVLLTAAPGVLRDAADERSVLTRCELPGENLSAYAASAGMHRKLVAAQEALSGGVARVHIADGRVPAPVSVALSGAGTVLVSSGKEAL